MRQTSRSKIYTWRRTAGDRVITKGRNNTGKWLYVVPKQKGNIFRYALPPPQHRTQSTWFARTALFASSYVIACSSPRCKTVLSLEPPLVFLRCRRPANAMAAGCAHCDGQLVLLASSSFLCVLFTVGHCLFPLPSLPVLPPLLRVGIEGLEYVLVALSLVRIL